MKRIIICADGTWNEPERRDKKTGRLQPTNVLKIARSLLPRAANGTEQVVYYHEGVGTGGPLDTVSGGAFGSGMELNVRALYRFIVNNYADGDELYFFGFSRGAFTVRTLSGFMDKVGLLHKRDEYYTPELYRLYELSEPYGSTKWEHAFRNVAERRPCPPIRFIGVFDTVGSLGAPGAIGQLFAKDKYKYHDIGLNNHIKNAYHALAIDERRKPFIPSLWEKPANWTGELKQVWFAGAHANAGEATALTGSPTKRCTGWCSWLSVTKFSSTTHISRTMYLASIHSSATRCRCSIEPSVNMCVPSAPSSRTARRSTKRFWIASLTPSATTTLQTCRQDYPWRIQLVSPGASRALHFSEQTRRNLKNCLAASLSTGGLYQRLPPAD